MPGYLMPHTDGSRTNRSAHGSRTEERYSRHENISIYQLSVPA